MVLPVPHAEEPNKCSNRIGDWIYEIEVVRRKFCRFCPKLTNRFKFENVSDGKNKQNLLATN